MLAVTFPLFNGATRSRVVRRRTGPGTRPVTRTAGGTVGPSWATPVIGCAERFNATADRPAVRRRLFRGGRPAATNLPLPSVEGSGQHDDPVATGVLRGV